MTLNDFIQILPKFKTNVSGEMKSKVKKPVCHHNTSYRALFHQINSLKHTYIHDLPIFGETVAAFIRWNRAQSENDF